MRPEGFYEFVFFRVVPAVVILVLIFLILLMVSVVFNWPIHAQDTMSVTVTR